MCVKQEHREISYDMLCMYVSYHPAHMQNMASLQLQGLWRFRINTLLTSHMMRWHICTGFTHLP